MTSPYRPRYRPLIQAAPSHPRYITADTCLTSCHSGLKVAHGPILTSQQSQPRPLHCSVYLVLWYVSEQSTNTARQTDARLWHVRQWQSLLLGHCAYTDCSLYSQMSLGFHWLWLVTDFMSHMHVHNAALKLRRNSVALQQFDSSLCDPISKCCHWRSWGLGHLHNVHTQPVITAIA